MPMSMIEVVSAAQMRALDQETINRIGIPGAVLMESAGRGVLELLRRLDREGRIDLCRGQAVIVAGPGNNGGDGFVVYRYLMQEGVRARLVLCAERDKVRGDALLNLEVAERLGGVAEPCTSEDDMRALCGLLGGLARGDVIVDALLGTGLSRPPRGLLRQAILAMNASPATRVSVDLPSGLDADRGIPGGDLGEGTEPAIVRAHHTVTFAFPKIALVSAPGFVFAGELHVVDIGIPRALCARHGVAARLLDETCLARMNEPRDPLGHKGSHGHLLVLAGSPGKTGAALLAARGATRAGVGLCTIASPPEVQAALQAQVLEVMTASYTTLDELVELCAGKAALAIGPGLPTWTGMKDTLLGLLGSGSAPCVLDADALNLLAGDLKVLRGMPRKLVLTPHPGEAARLLGAGWSTKKVQQDRFECVRELARQSGAVVVLKGARTLVAAPADPEPHVSIAPVGNAGMGSGGMGDVLCGMVGALLAGGVPPYEAACAAVYWHGRAGDLLMEALPPSAILLAGDLSDALPRTLAAILR